MPFGRIVRVDRQQASARWNPIDARVVQAAQQMVERAVFHEEYLPVLVSVPESWGQAENGDKVGEKWPEKSGAG